LSSNLPGDHKNSKKPEPFGELMKSMNEFFNEKPIKGFLQTMDEFFKRPFPFDAGFRIDLRETDNEYIVTAELPGVKREQIHIHANGNYLTITVENNELETSEDERNHSFQRRYLRQHSSRTITLPQSINEKLVKASYRDGLLQIKIPRIKGTVIEIDD
jgi:HSP20 family protein